MGKLEEIIFLRHPNLPEPYLRDFANIFAEDMIFRAADFLALAIFIFLTSLSARPAFSGDAGKPGRTLSRRCCELKKGVFLGKPVMPNVAIYVSGRELSDTCTRSCRRKFVPASRTSFCFAILHHLRGCAHVLLLSSQKTGPCDGAGPGIEALVGLVVSDAFIETA